MGKLQGVQDTCAGTPIGEIIRDKKTKKKNVKDTRKRWKMLERVNMFELWARVSSWQFATNWHVTELKYVRAFVWPTQRPPLTFKETSALNQAEVIVYVSKGTEPFAFALDILLVRWNVRAERNCRGRKVFTVIYTFSLLWVDECVFLCTKTIFLSYFFRVNDNFFSYFCTVENPSQPLRVLLGGYFMLQLTKVIPLLYHYYSESGERKNQTHYEENVFLRFH